MSESPCVHWVDVANFKERWDVNVENVGEGGQGVGHRAMRKGDRREAFVKVIDEESTERRTRVFNEAQAYQALDGLDVPRLIESNAHLYADKNCELFIATEFVEGKTLRDWRSGKKLDVVEAIDITLHLLGTVEKAHDAGVVHRDIKPENIIMREADGDFPVLVDFGIAFNRHIVSKKDLTADGQQLGNRFLLLPEFLPGSKDKRQEISDLTYVAGIFFFLLTGKNPLVLTHSDGSLPHQRDRVKDVFDKLANNGTKAFFDRAFRWSPSDRFQSARDLKGALHRILERTANPEPVDDLETLRNLLVDKDLEIKARSTEHLKKALNWAVSCYSRVQSLTEGKLIARQYTADSGANPAYVAICWERRGTVVAYTYLWVEVVGTEFVWHSLNGEVFRAPVHMQYDSAVSADFDRKSVIPDIVRIIKSEPMDLPEEFSSRHALIERTAFSVDAAFDKSRKFGVPVYAIIYDDLQSVTERHHLLEQVLGDDVVGTVIQAKFVLLIVKHSQLPEDVVAPRHNHAWTIIENSEWSHMRSLVANRGAARRDFTVLEGQYSKAEML